MTERQCKLGLHVMAWLILLVGAGSSGIAQTLEVKHPVLDYQIDQARAGEYEKAVETVMAMSEEEMLSFLPDHAFVRFCECPNCYGGVEGNSIFTWTIDRPDELTCRFCGTVYPNEKYPETHVMTGHNKLGEEISFPYYLNEELGVAHFLSTHVMLHKRGWIQQQCQALGKAYQTTGDERYARRVVLVLDKLAQRYPRYPVMQNGPRLFRFRESQDIPYAWDSGKWGDFHNEIPKSMVYSYDMVCESPEFDRLSRDRGYDVREKLENDVFRPTFDAIAASPYHVGNVVGYDIAGAAELGRIINEPYFVHRAFGWMKRNIDEGFYADGMWKEGSPAYHSMTIGGLRLAFSTVEGYSDPPGYVDPETGQRFDNLDPFLQLPFWAKIQSAPYMLDWPNGRSACVHDTHPYAKTSPQRNATTSTIMPAFGHASLGRGIGGDQMQAQLHFSGAYGHHHFDNLNLSLYAKGNEMLPDVGYTWTQMRYWTVSSLGHNLVVVDRTDQVGGDSDGDLMAYFPDTSGVSVVEADGINAYKNIEGMDQYRRLLVMVPVSDADAYLLDVFRVRGGQIHDWTLNGDADEDSIGQASLPLQGNREWMLEEGEEWEEPTMEGDRFHAYGMVRDVAQAETGGDFHVDFTYEEDRDKGIRVHMLNADPVEVWLGRSPSVRRMGVGTAGDMRKAYDFWMPKLLVRHQSAAPLHSVFTAVHEPYAEQRFIDRVERIDLTPADDDAVAVRITCGNTVDTIISTQDAPPYPERVTSDGISFRGRLGILRQVDGKSTGMWMFDGEKLSADWAMEADHGQFEGTIESAMRVDDGAEHDAFVTDAQLPEGGLLHGVWMIVRHGNGHTHGYEIDRVEQRDGKCLVILSSDHGLRIEGDNTEEVYFPLRKMEGVNSFVIPLATAMSYLP
ncbi:MAG: hypothetical protein GX358_09480 [candidate division WS1 bacterium]|nr:hypothetical protein [candidate division WS1 bacterium]